MMWGYKRLLVIFLIILSPNVLAQQTPGLLSVLDIEKLLRAGVSTERVAVIIAERGVNFALSSSSRERLIKAGADATLLQAIDRAGRDFAKRREEASRTDETRRGEQKKNEDTKPIQREQQPGVDVEMVLIPAGEFWMGADDGDADEKPRRLVYVDVFRIDRYEVTSALYKRFMEATGQAAPSFWGQSEFNGPAQPVVGVTWDNAQEFCKWARKRLPTEAEWEKAARGTDGRRYPWGDQWDSSRTNSSESKIGKPSEVGSYPSGMSPYGIYDMAGNVWEWVSDWYDVNYYRLGSNRNPQGPSEGTSRTIRGGSWSFNWWNSRSPNREGLDPTFRFNSVGFRCAQ